MKNLSACLLLSILSLPSVAMAGIVNLGSADNYIFATASEQQWSGNLLLGSEAHIFGNVAASNTLELGSGVIVEGNACATSPNDWGSTVVGETGSCINLTRLANDIRGAAMQAQTFETADLGDVSGTSEVLGAGLQSFSINDLLLAEGETLTISGNEDDYFVFNIFGRAKLSSGANILLQGGVVAENVIFNFVANPFSNSFEIGAANISGTFLSSGRSFILGDGATLNNSRFYSTESIIANVQEVRFSTNPADVVEFTATAAAHDTVSVSTPSAFTIFVLGVVGLMLGRFKEFLC